MAMSFILVVLFFIFRPVTTEFIVGKRPLCSDDGDVLNYTCVVSNRFFFRWVFESAGNSLKELSFGRDTTRAGYVINCTIGFSMVSVTVNSFNISSSSVTAIIYNDTLSLNGTRMKCGEEMMFIRVTKSSIPTTLEISQEESGVYYIHPQPFHSGINYRVSSLNFFYTGVVNGPLLLANMSSSLNLTFACQNQMVTYNIVVCLFSDHQEEIQSYTLQDTGQWVISVRCMNETFDVDVECNVNGNWNLKLPCDRKDLSGGKRDEDMTAQPETSNLYIIIGGVLAVVAVIVSVIVLVLVVVICKGSIDQNKAVKQKSKGSSDNNEVYSSIHRNIVMVTSKAEYDNLKISTTSCQLKKKIQSEYGVLNSKTRITPSEKSYDYAEPTVQPDLTKKEDLAYSAVNIKTSNSRQMVALSLAPVAYSDVQFGVVGQESLPSRRYQNRKEEEKEKPPSPPPVPSRIQNVGEMDYFEEAVDKIAVSRERNNDLQEAYAPPIPKRLKLNSTQETLVLEPSPEGTYSAEVKNDSSKPLYPPKSVAAKSH